MTVPELLELVHESGAEIVRLAPDRLRVLRPHLLPPRLMDELRAVRPQLLEYLAPHSCVSCGKFSYPVAGVVCYWCRPSPTQAGGAVVPRQSPPREL